jgi:hypothetical protein
MATRVAAGQTRSVGAVSRGAENASREAAGAVMVTLLQRTLGSARRAPSCPIPPAFVRLITGLSRTPRVADARLGVWVSR